MELGTPSAGSAVNTIWKAGVGDNVSRTQRRPPLLQSGPHTKEMDAQGAVTLCPSPERPVPSWGACPLPHPCRRPPGQPVHMLSWDPGAGPPGGQGQDLVHPRSERVKVIPNSSNRSRALARGSELGTRRCWGHAPAGDTPPGELAQAPQAADTTVLAQNPHRSR